MSLLQKASIITTPTAYAEDFLYNIKPAGGYGNEKVTNGTFDTDSNWGKSSGATISNGKANIVVTSGGFQYIDQGLTYVAGKKYRLTATIQGTSGKALRFQDNSSNTGGLQVSNGTVDFNGKNQYVDITWTANSNSNLLIIARSGTGDFSFTIDNVSVKELVDFDFDRNSTGTRVNEDYLIETVPYNLLKDSENIISSTWSTSSVTLQRGFLDPQGTLNATQITSTGNDPYLYDFIQADGDGYLTYTASVYLKASDNTIGSTVRIWLIRDNADFLYEDVIITDKWKRYSITKTFSTHIQNFGYIRVDAPNDNPPLTGKKTFIWGAQIVAGNQPKDYLKTTDRLDIPRIDYTNGEGSVLLEPQRQNLVTSSTDYSNSAWSKNNLTVTLNSAISPEGIMNASLLVENSSNAQRFIGDSLTISQGTTCTISVYAKKKVTSVLQVSPSTAYMSASHANYDLDSGVVSATGGSITAEIQSLANDWYRCILTFTATGTGTGQTAFFLQNNPTAIRGAAYQGDGSSGIYLYGAQIEVGSYPTSLIHTSGSAVTRSADAANNAGNSDLFNDSEGVLYCEIKATANDLSQRRITISDGSLNNRVGIEYTSSTNQIRGRVTDGGSGQADMQFTTVDITEYLKIAIKYKVNNCSLYINGKQVENDLSATMPSGLDKLSFDQSTNVLNYYGNVKSVMVFKEALTDLELEKLTGYNNHELYMNYYNRLSYLGLAEEYNVESDINNYIL